jgi:hypothetical protein
MMIMRSASNVQLTFHLMHYILSWLRQPPGPQRVVIDGGESKSELALILTGRSGDLA